MSSKQNSEDAKYTQSINGCARCWGDGHENLTFKKLTHPVEDENENPTYTHWAPCPTNGEPILLQFFDDSDIL